MSLVGAEVTEEFKDLLTEPVVWQALEAQWHRAQPDCSYAASTRHAST